MPDGVLGGALEQTLARAGHDLHVDHLADGVDQGLHHDLALDVLLEQGRWIERAHQAVDHQVLGADHRDVRRAPDRAHHQVAIGAAGPDHAGERRGLARAGAMHGVLRPASALHARRHLTQVGKHGPRALVLADGDAAHVLFRAFVAEADGSRQSVLRDRSMGQAQKAEGDHADRDYEQ